MRKKYLSIIILFTQVYQQTEPMESDLNFNVDSKGTFSAGISVKTSNPTVGYVVIAIVVISVILLCFI